MTSGSFTAQGGAIKIGTAAINELFDEYYINDANTIQVATLESDGGTGNLRLGRKDGVASSPGIYLNSSVQTANYNVALVATGGNATDGSGTLNAQVVNANGLPSMVTPSGTMVTFSSSLQTLQILLSRETVLVTSVLEQSQHLSLVLLQKRSEGRRYHDW